MRSSISSAELPTTTTSAAAIINDKNSNKQNCGGISLLQWNPFEDRTPFNQMTEDHIYEAEFDALRDRPSGSVYLKYQF